MGDDGDGLRDGLGESFGDALDGLWDGLWDGLDGLGDGPLDGSLDVSGCGLPGRFGGERGDGRAERVGGGGGIERLEVGEIAEDVEGGRRGASSARRVDGFVRGDRAGDDARAGGEPLLAEARRLGELGGVGHVGEVGEIVRDAAEVGGGGASARRRDAPRAHEGERLGDEGGRVARVSRSRKENVGEVSSRPRMAHRGRTVRPPPMAFQEVSARAPRGRTTSSDARRPAVSDCDAAIARRGMATRRVTVPAVTP